MKVLTALVLALCATLAAAGSKSQTHPEAGQCYNCTDATSEDDCRDNGNIVDCPDSAYGACKTVVRTDDEGTTLITKGCRSLLTCRQDKTENEDDCIVNAESRSTCIYCCECDLCNYGIDTTTCRMCEKEKSGSKKSGSKNSGSKKSGSKKSGSKKSLEPCVCDPEMEGDCDGAAGLITSLTLLVSMATVSLTVMLH